jgi:molybdopterin converting factor small subunit
MAEGRGGRLRRWFGRGLAKVENVPTVRVQVLVRGRIGDGWYDVDRSLDVPAGMTLGRLIDEAQRRYGVPLARAVAESPHLAHTLMINGERCPVAEHRDRVMADGDELYLLAPIAGG